LLPTAYPIQTAFIYTAIFPNTTMVYLVPRDHAPFATLTDHILACGIRVIPNLFMKVAIPHCTVAWFEEHAEQEIAKALSFPAPTEELVFDTLSMYTIVPSGVVRHWIGKLQGNTPLGLHKL
jgi:hypothetical protein